MITLVYYFMTCISPNPRFFTRAVVSSDLPGAERFDGCLEEGEITQVGWDDKENRWDDYC
jgi:hypothetical protein